jgi:regulator of PEP synthase PpsR (kinase-PPPase family)
MDNTNDSFERDMDQLIRLFKKIKTKTTSEQFAHLDPAFVQNIDFIINNFEMVKGNIPKEMFIQMGIPFQQLLKEFIKQMKQELGEDFAEEVEPEVKVQKSELANDIEKIDLMLKNPGLSEEELNALLDKRSDLIRDKDNGLLSS